ncbi:MAG: HD domain-containing protein, partial [Spirochaetales bacterium]|nr:HD domain-containing protein [Spirochaetales bacterium]
PGMDGYQVIESLKSRQKTKSIPVIFLTAKNQADDEAKGLKLGAVDYISKPINLPIVLARVKTHLDLYDHDRHLEELVRVRTRELNETRLQIIQRLGRASEYKDNETGMHIMRMSYYTHIIAQGAGLSEDEAEVLLHATPMHDVGKIGVPDHIISKNGPLTPQERAIIERHPTIGAEIIGEHHSELLKVARTVALTHHEKWDGSGYPGGIAGEDIPLWGRIAAVADVFDALTTKRPYKPAWSIEEACDVLRRERGRHFDPALVPIFLERLEMIVAIKEQYSEG